MDTDLDWGAIAKALQIAYPREAQLSSPRIGFKDAQQGLVR
jgi:hypothetical protein